MLTIAECAYIAGIVDGEGCLTVSKRMPAKGKSYSYRPEAIIVQAPRGKALIDWLQPRIGGAVHLTKSGTYALRLAARDTERLVRLIEPYSVVKADQCRLLCRFFATFEGGTSGRFDAREAIFQELSALHGGSKVNKRRVW